jgi:hypothetical protein
MFLAMARTRVYCEEMYKNVAFPFAVTYYFNFKPDNILLKCPTEYSL